MGDLVGPLEYPLYLFGNMEYWEAKRKFKFLSSDFSVWSMIAVKQGRFSFTVGSVRGEAVKGDIVLIPPNMEFTRNIIDPLSFFLICFKYREAVSPDEAHIIRLLRDWFGYIFRTPEQDRILNNYRQLLNLYEQNDKRSQRWVTHYLCDIWLLFCKEAEMRDHGGKASQDSLMQAVKDWIDREAESDIKLQDMARHFNLHPVQLTRRFQKTFGISPSRYLYTIRIEKAKSLLIETDYTIDHIGQLCGYHNGFYFSRIFTQYTKMNPSAFRKIHSLHTL